MYQAQFSHNPLYCVDIIKTYKPDFTPRVAFILGKVRISGEILLG